MPNKIVEQLVSDMRHLRNDLEVHLRESSGIKKELEWLKWINMGIAALVLLRLVADWIIK